MAKLTAGQVRHGLENEPPSGKKLRQLALVFGLSQKQAREWDEDIILITLKHLVTLLPQDKVLVDTKNMPELKDEDDVVEGEVVHEGHEAKPKKKENIFRRIWNWFWEPPHRRWGKATVTFIVIVLLAYFRSWDWDWQSIALTTGYAAVLWVWGEREQLWRKILYTVVAVVVLISHTFRQQWMQDLAVLAMWVDLALSLFNPFGVSDPLMEA